MAQVSRRSYKIPVSATQNTKENDARRVSATELVLLSQGLVIKRDYIFESEKGREQEAWAIANSQQDLFDKFSFSKVDPRVQVSFSRLDLNVFFVLLRRSFQIITQGVPPFVLPQYYSSPFLTTTSTCHQLRPQQHFYQYFATLKSSVLLYTSGIAKRTVCNSPASTLHTSYFIFILLYMYIKRQFKKKLKK